MLSRGERGSVVTLICDGGERYSGTYYDDAWVGDQGLELAPHTDAVETFLECGAFPAVGRPPPSLTPIGRAPRPR